MSEKDDKQISQTISCWHNIMIKRVVKTPNNSAIDMSTSYYEDESNKKKMIVKK